MPPTTPKRPRKEVRPADLPPIRQNLVKLAAVQGVLLAAALLVFAVARPQDTRAVLLLVALAALPLLVSLWGWLYWRALQQAASGPDLTLGVVAANARAVKLLGALFGAWVVGVLLVVLLA